MSFSENEILAYAQHLKEKKVLAYPTDTFWGLGADIYSDEALKNLYSLKKRDPEKPMSVLVSGLNMVLNITKVPMDLQNLMSIVWPNPVTFVIPCEKKFPLIQGEQDFLGFRSSPHPFVKTLFCHFDKPITTTSANKSGKPPAQSLEDLNWLSDDIVKKVKIYETIENHQKSLGSTVIRCFENHYEVLRAGDFKIEDFDTLARQCSFSKNKKKVS